MGKKTKAEARSGKTSVPSATPSGARRWTIALALAAGAVAAVWGWKSFTSPSARSGDDSVSGAATNQTKSGTAPARPEFQKLKARWQRPDGGYVLEIKGVESNGRLDAGYFNPNPIHVARAAAIQVGGQTKVFVELRDINYPGSTYSLVYDPTSDQLQGNYFQALEQQNFDVVFIRMKQD